MTRADQVEHARLARLIADRFASPEQIERCNALDAQASKHVERLKERQSD